MECWVVNVAALESADIGGPPRDPRQSHIETCGKLIAKSMERRVYVA